MRLFRMVRVFVFVLLLAIGCGAEDMSGVIRALEAKQSQMSGLHLVSDLESVASRGERETTFNENFEIHFYGWGYFARKVNRSSNQIASAAQIPRSSIALRSNDYSLDIIINGAVPKGNQRAIEISGSEAFIWGEKRPSFVPIFLIPSALMTLLQKLDAVTVVRTNDASGNQCLLVKGDDKSLAVIETWELLLSPNRSMAPLRGRVVANGSTICAFSSEFVGKPDDSYFPGEFVSTLFSGQRAFTDRYTHIEVAHASEMPTSDDIVIPPGTLVNDYTLGEGFAYYMGRVAPKARQLQEMSTSVKAIEDYQQGGLVVSAMKVGGPINKNRRMVILGLLSLVTLLGGGYLLWRCARRSARTVLVCI